ncbi:hypothetical protein DPMN_094241 [Dreissena polymorpha]|uniref:Uncharacterized protein n=1 Tax=Dreissena polymorpha TaxID=45954 RepID=A0A9D4L7A4_DREPO|nr:hypothetical protein DPMN_094241 [Dreissena polymorpha]
MNKWFLQAISNHRIQLCQQTLGVKDFRNGKGSLIFTWSSSQRVVISASNLGIWEASLDFTRP